jgi:hypothetical protein
MFWIEALLSGRCSVSFRQACVTRFSLLRIPVKWSGDSGDVGQHRSEATLGCSYISEVDHLSQESGQVGCTHHHFVSGSPESRKRCIPFEVVQDSV